MELLEIPDSLGNIVDRKRFKMRVDRVGKFKILDDFPFLLNVPRFTNPKRSILAAEAISDLL